MHIWSMIILFWSKSFISVSWQGECTALVDKPRVGLYMEFYTYTSRSQVKEGGLLYSVATSIVCGVAKAISG